MVFSQKIYVLEPSTFKQKELNLDAYEAFVNIKYLSVIDVNNIPDLARDAEVIILNKLKITKPILLRMPKLQYIGITATGMDNVDVEAANELDIHVQNVKGYSTFSVAQHVVALMLKISTNITLHHNAVKDGSWSKHNYFSLWKQGITELKDKQIGLVGFGDIAKRLAKIAIALGMKVLVYNRSKIQVNDPGIVQLAQIDQLLLESDFVSLHVPMAKNTAAMANAAFFAKMKSSAVFINTARGGLVDEAALFYALKTGKIRAAGLDVLQEEPPPLDHPLSQLENCIITPHIAWASIEARQRLLDKTADQIKAYFS